MEYRIIIAEDEEIERTALRLILHTRMPQLKIAAETNNGVELLELCRKKVPDIVLLDINMPGINGLDAMEQIIQNYPDIHFIILSAYADFGYAQRALKLGADDYLTKPIKTDLLIAALNRLMDKMQSATQDTAEMFQMTKKWNSSSSRWNIISCARFFPARSERISKSSSPFCLKAVHNISAFWQSPRRRRIISSILWKSISI